MNTYMISLRSWARKLNLIRAINYFRYGIIQRSVKYEDSFGLALLSHIKPGDVVWDVGANLGLYTQQFLERVGPGGLVVAFEPAPACYGTLDGKFSRNAAVRLENVAMGSKEGSVCMRLADNPLAATHQVVDADRSSGEQEGAVEVPVVSGDAYWKRHDGHAPNVIKIDVEGYEEEVLNGMSELLGAPALRAIFCEVHFGLLEAKGEMMAPKRIEEMLRRSGFKTKWIDSSHIQAVR